MDDRILKRVLSDENIFLSIFTVESYIQNPELLSTSDINKLNNLRDPFINNSKYIKKIRERINDVLCNNDGYFKVDVYFKPKKYNEEETKVIFRPLHTASLIDQIAMVAMLQVLVYDIDEGNKLVASQLSRLIPSNFYGNRISYDGEKLFKPWQEQYHKYISDSNDAMYKNSKDNKYKYEVTLDLINFFPSINPCALINFIEKNRPVDLNESEIKTFEKIVKKLTFFKLGELTDCESKWYYPNCKGKIKYVKGIPQGLPHSYFLGNIFMILIKDEYEKIFPGDMFFYVDDSVIFTNDIGVKDNEESFNDSIKTLNMELKKLNTVESNFDLPEDYDFDASSTSTDYLIEVHSFGDKTSYYKIEEAIKNSGELYLHSLSRETSNLGFDIYSSYTSDELETLCNKTKTILEIVNEELEKISNNDNNISFSTEVKKQQYKDKLSRYKKFFSYRNQILNFIIQKDDNYLIKEVKKIFREIDSQTLPHNKKLIFFKYYNEDIFLALIDYALKKKYVNTSDFNFILKELEKINGFLYGDESEKSYLNKLYSKNKYGKIFECIRYNTICDKVTYVFKANWKNLLEHKSDIIKNFIDKNTTTEKIFKLLKCNYMKTYYNYVAANTNELVRMIYNTVISFLLNYEISDSSMLVKRTNEPIQYSEVRILMYLRNKDFRLETFKDTYDSFINAEYQYPIDYNLIQILNDFKLFVRDSSWIDNLILIHKYCSDTWKNGSKYLYFYTLHNQEHAVALIKNSIEIIHKISYFNIKPFDYYILFAACYLHDISMVSFPSMEKFYELKNSDTNKIYTDFISDLDISDVKKTKKDLCDCYKEIDSYFEADIRRNHAKDSANDIRRYPELRFLSDSDRELIARISESHGYNALDIYWTKSKAKDELANEKMVSILLRLSDLLDISRYRISKIILSHNLKNLNYVSRFHWLSHLVTEGYSLKTEYTRNKNSEIDNYSKTFLKKDSITEKLVLTINVLMSQNTSTNQKKCKYVSQVTNEDDGTVVYKLDSEKTCNSMKCGFLCKWFTIKNDYLIQELAILKKYLNSVVDNYFNFDVLIKVKPVKKTIITNEEFDYLKEYLEKY